ncbi:MAG: fibronectin type III domain-containing protein [Minisyncoccota bacterium]
MTKILIKNFFFKITTLLAVIFVTAFFSPISVEAAVAITAATGGTNISADNAANAASPAWTTLGNIVITSQANNDFAKNATNATLILTIPSNWAFNAGVGSGSVSGTGITFNSISVTASIITVTYTRTNTNSSNASLTISGIQVRSTDGSLLPNSGNILRTAANPGTGTIIGITNDVTNFGSLSQVVGAKNKLAFTTQPSSSATINTDFTIKPVVTLQDQFGSTVTSDSSSVITRSAVLSTQVCGGTAGSGVLSSTPVSGATVTAGVMTYTAMQYSFGESIKICAVSTGVTSALSNAITVNNPVPTTSSISPTSKTVGDAQFTLTVNGSNFVSNSVVQFAGSNRTTIYGSSSQLTATIPATDLLSAGNYNITVFNPTPGGGTSNAQTFTVNPAGDTTAPAAVSDLATTNPTNNSIDLTWTAPGDDNNTGTATTYDVRYSTSVITALNFASANQATGEPSPSIAGSSESMTISGLSASTLYYFAIKTSDEVPNTSAISNVPSGSTTAGADAIAPTVTAFSIPSTSTSLTVSITTFTATDNVGVTGYLVNESPSSPSISDSGWTTSIPANYIFSSEGSKTLYAWAKDAAGNVSISLNDAVVITLPVTEVITPDQIQSTISSGIIVPNSLITASSQITFTQQVQINFTTGSIIVVPINSVMSAGTNVDFSQLSATSNVTACSLPENYTSLGAVNFGLPSFDLTSTQAVTVSIFVGSTYNTQTLYVYKKSPSESSCSQLTTCVVSGSYCEFTTTGFSNFFGVKFTSPVVSSGSGASQPTSVVFSGRAYPDGKVRIYRRSIIENLYKNDYLPNFDIETTGKGDFNKTFIGLFQSNYLFALEGIDKTGQSGGIISFTTNLLSNNSLVVNEIFLPPTISVQNKFITKGNEIKVVGYAYPNSSIELKIDNVLRINSLANDSGYYEAIINTSRFSPKVHFIAAKQTDRYGRSSEFSTSKNFTVSSLSNPRADFNGDNVIDIRDWSIFLFRWKANPTLRAFNDLNLDGKVDILDLSIFLKAMKGL